MRKVIIVLIAIIVAAGATFGVYEWQNKKVDNLQEQQTALKQKVSSLQSQYAAAQAADSVSTANWKKYSDPYYPFSFDYPSQWKLTNNSLNVAGDKRAYASLTDPNKTMQVSYTNPLIKDGGSLSARVVKAYHITVDNTKLAVLGIIPVSSGEYQPSYVILGGSQALSITPNNNAVLLYGSINPRFNVGTYDAILFTGGPTKNSTSYAQAQAWFDSVNGNTVLKVLESLSAQ
jgi:hypothetical protein